MTHIIVTGSRDATTDEDWSYIFSTLSYGLTDAESLSHGCAPGVDTIAGAWAEQHGIKVHEFPADWAANGKAAGPIRNRLMLRETIKRYGVKNIVVLGFTNKPLEQSRGTSGCMMEAGRKGLVTHLFRTDLRVKEF